MRFLPSLTGSSKHGKSRFLASFGITMLLICDIWKKKLSLKTWRGAMKITARELAAAIGANLEGDGLFEISGVAAPERAASGDLIFVDSAKHIARAEASRAKCVVLPLDLALSGKTVLRAENAKVAFAKAATLLREQSLIANGVHPTAVIGPLAKIAPNASIGPYAVISEDVHIGENTQIGAHSVIGEIGRASGRRGGGVSGGAGVVTETDE